MDIDHHLNECHANRTSSSVRCIAYGGIDGVITTFSIVCSSYATGLSNKHIITLGASNLFADAFSMGFGNFISSRMENMYILHEKLKEVHEYNTNLYQEKDELKSIYIKKYEMAPDDANVIVETMSKYDELFMSNMMSNELNLPSDTKSTLDISKDSLYTFVSFVAFGGVVLIPFATSLSTRDVIFISAVLSLFTCFFIGAFVAVYIRQYDQLLKNGMLTMLNGFVAFVIAYSIGYLSETYL